MLCAHCSEAWLSWLEHTVHIREVTGSSPVASTTFYQSAPVADCFFMSVLATKLELDGSRRHHAMHGCDLGHTARCAPDCKQSRSADERVLLPPPHLPIRTSGGLFFYVNGLAAIYNCRQTMFVTCTCVA